MTRITTTILVFMLLLNGGITVMEGSGFAEDAGVTLAPGIAEDMEQVKTDAKNGFSASEGLGDTLFSLFAAAMGTFNILIKGVFAAPEMFMNLGFPSWIVIPIFGPMYLIATLELIYAATGRLLV